MFTLIIGIVLGALLLFVILLLVTEVFATYPVWARFGSAVHSLSPESSTPKKNKRIRFRLLLAVVIVLGLSSIAFVITNLPQRVETPPVVEAKSSEAPKSAFNKLLSDSLPGYGLLFLLQTKWDGGKMYGNNRVAFSTNASWRFTDCRYFLLDREDYLIKELPFTQNDFVFEMQRDSSISGMINRFQVEMPLSEYRKIDKVQVVLDRKLLAQVPFTQR